jgi:hypothetical protein
LRRLRKGRGKNAAIAKFLYVAESALRRWLARTGGGLCVVPSVVLSDFSRMYWLMFSC